MHARPRAGNHEPVALVTGFEPFGGDTVNPSWLAVERLPGRIGPWRVERARLPVSFREAFPTLERELDRTRPSLALCVGVAAKRPAVCVERVAINLDDARSADNLGECPVERTILPGAPAAYFSPLPVRRIAARLAAAAIPAVVSTSAGTFVCNHVMFRLLDQIARGAGPPLGGFLHVPATPEMPGRTGNAPGLPLERIVEAVAIAVEVCAEEAGAGG